MEIQIDEVQNCVVKLRENPRRNKEKVIIACGAGFAGDRAMGALKVLQKINKLDYLILECLAERTLADRYKIMMSGGKGYDPKIKEWMSLLLPLAIERGVCIITNMGAVDPLGAQKEVLNTAADLGFKITVSVAHELSEETLKTGSCTYLGAAPIVYCLEKYKPNIIITSRIADASLFLAPMVYELGWNWNEYELLAKGALTGHLLECGCQLTGGYFMHPGDVYRDFSFEKLLEVSLPFAEIDYKGEIHLLKLEESGGEISFNTCAQQLLYEIGDPSCYITPDVIIDIRDVRFDQVSENRVFCTGAKPSLISFPEKLLQLVPTDCGWKGWGEISYGGLGCIKRAQAAEFLVRSWINETFPEIGDKIMAYIIGHNSLKIPNGEDPLAISNGEDCGDVRLRMDGLFEQEKHAVCFTQEFMALYTNGPAGGGGISTGHKKEIILHKKLVERENIYWQTNSKQTNPSNPHHHTSTISKITKQSSKTNFPKNPTAPIQQKIPSGTKLPLYKIAHGRAGDKGNDLNFSLIPHISTDITRLKKVITVNWVKIAVSPLFNLSTFCEKREVMEGMEVEIYEVRGISSLNVVVRNVLDGGVNCSRRIDRHGKTLSDLILCQVVVLP
ncbi:hypothetical protein LUZ60_014707 [Juncus effusus]|nr:hypothetical protein LUZ60_014707 [Juncus effusus]